MRSYLFSNVQKFWTPCAMTLILYWNIIKFNLKMLCKGLLITKKKFCNLITADVMPLNTLYSVYNVPVAQWLEHCVSSAKVVGSIPREHTY